MSGIEFNNTEHGRKIAAEIPRQYNPGVDTVISRTRDGRLLGGVIYDGYTGSCIFAHQAGFDKHWLNRDMLWVLFDYPFNQLDCLKVCGTIPADHTALLDFNARLGFKVECVLKNGYPGTDMLVLSMTRAECRWLQVRPATLRSNLAG